MNSRSISRDRAEVLKSRIEDYINIKDEITTSIDTDDVVAENRKKILEYFSATEEDWNDWKWQTKNRITDVETLSKFINISDEETENINKVGKKFRWAISPYYVSLMDKDDPKCPIRKQAIPDGIEMLGGGEADPMGEEFTSPVEHITRRYPDRLIIKVTNQCAMYCRHCQRRRAIGESDLGVPKDELQKCIDYVAENPEVRDILLTGGDALLLSDETIEWIVSRLRAIEHVEIIRLGSRTPVTMPQRVTPELTSMLQKYHPIYLNTHFNSPKEISKEAKKATEMLANCGIQLGNQAVLLKGINDDKFVMRKMNQEMLRIRVRPYYIFHPKKVYGTGHFGVKIQKGMEIMEYLRGYTSGMAIPTYIVNAPDGKGKTPILPNYLLSFGEDYVKFRTWEGEIFDYPN